MRGSRFVLRFWLSGFLFTLSISMYVCTIIITMRLTTSVSKISFTVYLCVCVCVCVCVWVCCLWCSHGPCLYASLRTLSLSWQFMFLFSDRTISVHTWFDMILVICQGWPCPRIRLVLFRLVEYASLSQKDLPRNAMTFSDAREDMSVWQCACICDSAHGVGSCLLYSRMGFVMCVMCSVAVARSPRWLDFLTYFPPSQVRTC